MQVDRHPLVAVALHLFLLKSKSLHTPSQCKLVIHNTGDSNSTCFYCCVIHVLSKPRKSLLADSPLVRQKGI